MVFISGDPGPAGFNPELNDVAIRRLRKSYNIIGYVPRGTGQSTPKISCQLPMEEQKPSFNKDISVSENRVRDKISACINQTGSEVSQHIGTDEAVNDLDVIRRALGEPSLTAVAYSYGTKVAALYAERFTKETQAVVLDGVVDISEDGFTQKRIKHADIRRVFCGLPLIAKSPEIVQSPRAPMKRSGPFMPYCKSCTPTH